MSGRPEEYFAGYDTDGYDQDAWQEFTPWRPGDPSTIDEAPSRAREEAGFSGLSELFEPAERPSYRPGHGGSDARPAVSEDPESQRPKPGRPHHHYHEGDQVRNRNAIRGTVFEHVPENTNGRIVDTETGILGDHWATVRFDNGHTETVRTEYLDRRGLFD